MKSEIEAKIEYRQLVGEVNPGGYRPVRFTRVKYKASPETHMDIRQFQRGYDEDGEDAFYPTKTGFRFLEREFRRVVREYAVVPEVYVHPRIIKKAFPLLNQGHFESAVLQAFKVLETTIRERIKAPADEVGLALLRRAFHPDDGPLTDTRLPRAERESFSNYVAGAFGYYKNPCSHRDVDMDFVTAFGRIAVASDLLKVVEAGTLRRRRRKRA
ncbi:MAG TPA: TIGR02391 family protein [Verrucomicrobiae bacterium]|nr:TIGR02391 family protein [Verrucomicrobiae bacterium]